MEGDDILRYNIAVFVDKNLSCLCMHGSIHHTKCHMQNSSSLITNLQHPLLVDLREGRRKWGFLDFTISLLQQYLKYCSDSDNLPILF